MKTDRVEKNNLVSEEPEIAERLKAKYEQWRSEMGKPMGKPKSANKNKNKK